MSHYQRQFIQPEQESVTGRKYHYVCLAIGVRLTNACGETFTIEKIGETKLDCDKHKSWNNRSLVAPRDGGGTPEKQNKEYCIGCTLDLINSGQVTVGGV